MLIVSESGVVGLLIIFCAVSFIMAPIAQHRAFLEGYGMCADGKYQQPSTYIGLGAAKNLTEQNHSVAGMPRDMFDRVNPLPANVLIDSMTINVRSDNNVIKEHVDYV